jgi:hypothetical protein
VAAVIVLVAAALLVAIWVTARRVLSEAQRALAAAEAIRDSTAAIWGLQATNGVAERILHSVEAIEKKGRALAEALEGRAVPR